ncbi:MAG: hypothetical protein JSS43_17150 [Proteobacteria bacterium]|nr:hypothetical protein [Pseudomonadota bacterium]
MPYKEEDEGYLAAEARQMLSDNPYPRGTLRYQHWERGWHIKNDEAHREDDESFLAAEIGLRLSDNPHPPGTIRYEEWRRRWHIKTAETQRAIRLGRR